MQITKFRKYKDNHNIYHGRLILTKQLTERFIGDGKLNMVNVKVTYDAENDRLIVEKIKVD